MCPMMIPCRPESRFSVCPALNWLGLREQATLPRRPGCQKFQDTFFHGLIHASSVKMLWIKISNCHMIRLPKGCPATPPFGSKNRMSANGKTVIADYEYGSPPISKPKTSRPVAFRRSLTTGVALSDTWSKYLDGSPLG